MSDNFTRYDYADCAALLRCGDDAIVKAALSNNFNIILSALDHMMELAKIKDALDSRSLFCNLGAMDRAADEIDCCPDCEKTWHEWDTNAGGCHASERGDYCPNDIAETLRELARVSIAFDAKETAP